MKHDHLKTHTSLKFRAIETFVSILQIVMHKVPILCKILRASGRSLIFIGNMDRIETDKRKYVKLIKESSGEPQKFGSGYGYADELYEFGAAVNYTKQLNSENFAGSSSESEMVYKYAINLMSTLLEKDRSIKNFVNFGVCYAYIDSELAKRFPDVNFIGVDRSRYTKLWNDYHFSSIKNMEFIAGDIMEVLAQRKLNNSVLFHARTMPYLPKFFIEKLYKIASESGFKYIVGMEQVGLSRDTLRFYEFSDDDKPDILFRGAMILHNYPALVKNSGFDLLHAELLKTNHPHEDVRVFYYLGKNKKLI